MNFLSGQEYFVYFLDFTCGSLFHFVKVMLKVLFISYAFAFLALVASIPQNSYPGEALDCTACKCGDDLDCRRGCDKCKELPGLCIVQDDLTCSTSPDICSGCRFHGCKSNCLCYQWCANSVAICYLKGGNCVSDSFSFEPRLRIIKS